MVTGMATWMAISKMRKRSETRLKLKQTGLKSNTSITDGDLDGDLDGDF